MNTIDPGGWTGAILIVLVHAGCATPQPASSRSDPLCPEHVIVHVGAGQGVILPAEHAYVDGDGTVHEYWTPTTEDVLQAEAGLAKFLAASVPGLAVKYSSYTRQYTGFVADGRKRILMNFLCWSPETPGWRCSPVVVDDGGDCYFHVEYDVKTGEHGRLWVNGGA